MLINKNLITGLAILSLTAACSSKPPAHLGETITTTDNGKGITVTQVDSRRLLPNGKMAGEESALVQIQAIVSQIDRKTRALTLQDAQGNSTRIVAGPEVRNFDQISAGDRVEVDYLVAVAFEDRKPTAEEIAAAGKNLDVSARARMGEMPAAGAAVANVKIATITAINKDTQTVSLTGLSSNGSVDVKAKYAENLSYIKVGDTVVVTSLEALATKVVRVP
jgi:hypothetical protein